MCILFLHTNPAPQDNEYRLIVATNRDEYYQRPAKSVFKCPNTNVIAGRDLGAVKKSGTWLGFVTKSYPENDKSPKHCFACLTNISNNIKVEHATGRGGLVIDYLEGKLDYPEYVEQLRKDGLHYNGYNFIAVELSKDGSTKTYHHSNQPQIDTVFTGKHTLGFGNTPVSYPYTKVIRGRENFLEIIEKGLEKDQLKEELIALLKDRTKHLPDSVLEKQRAPVADKLSSIFVDYSEAGYGTRTHTIVLIDKNWNFEFSEITMEDPIDPHNPQWKKTELKSNL